MNVFSSHLCQRDTDRLCASQLRYSRQCYDEQLLFLGAFALVHFSEAAIAVSAEGNKNEQSTPNTEYRRVQKN